MGRVIAVTVLLVAGVVFLLIMNYGFGKAAQRAEYQRLGYLDKRGAELVERACTIMTGLGVTSSLEEVEIISTAHKEAVARWLSDYKTWRG
jgi:hypothetical protein